MAGYVGRLESGDTLDASSYFTGPWRCFSRKVVDPGQTETFDAARAEYAIFVMSGEGTATVGTTTQRVDPGSALTVGYRASLVITAGGGPLELFVTTLNLDLNP